MKDEHPPVGMPKRVIQSLGMVFGDIGTSPIYTLTVIFFITRPTVRDTVGIVSLILWTIILLVGVQYAWLAMSLGRRGEGGTVVLHEILAPLIRSKKKLRIVSLLTFVGIALFFGDGVITPAISLLSAVEGLQLIPQLAVAGINKTALLIIASLIAVALFASQKLGTERISGAFGPVMAAWFLCLAACGGIAITEAPVILEAVNPYFALHFMTHNGLTAFIVLSEVILCATGGEALYADMGHMGRRPIVYASFLVFAALTLNYLGQGAYMIQNPDATYVLFEMVYGQISVLYIPFLVLTVMATVIASQAMISGIFSIVYQAINTGMLPAINLEYTSRHRQSQIYIRFVNGLLLVAVLFMMFFFRESERIAAAYGLAVTGTMTITSVLMTWIFHLRKQRFRMAVAFLITLINLVFLVSNLYKLPHGGYWSLIIAAIPLSIVLTYDYGKRRFYEALELTPLARFRERFSEAYGNGPTLQGTALFFSRDVTIISPYIVRTMFNSHIIYEENIVVSIESTNDPFGVSWFFTESDTPGLKLFTVRAGYMEGVDVESILKTEGIEENTIFYGMEEIRTKNPVTRMFSILRRLAPTFVQFHKLPAMKLHGVVTRYEL